MQPHIVFLDRDTLDMGDISFASLEAVGPFASAGHTDPTVADELAAHTGNADVAIVNKVKIDAAAMDAMPSVRHVAVIATGVNNVDLTAARERGIAVTNVAGYGRFFVSQHAFGLILELAGRIRHYARDVERGDWAAAESFTLLRYSTTELAGKTLGLIGWGAIAQHMARIAQGFGMRVVVANRSPIEAPPHRQLPLSDVLAESDVVSIHVPLTAETRGMVGAAELARMKPSAFLVNTARGGIVDETALIAALEAGTIAGAGLDVLEEEPPRTSTLPARAARGDLNLVITPHAAWSAIESRQRLVDEVAKNIASWAAGGTRNRVEGA